MSIANSLLQKAQEIFGDLKDARILDIYTPLTIRDYVNCPEGACYGLMRSSQQLLKVVSLIIFPFPASAWRTKRFGAGSFRQYHGSFNAARQIIGAERFAQEIKWMCNHGYESQSKLWKFESH